MPFPMLADFAVRLACGLALLLLLAPWRIVPPAFFRTHSQVILGLLVLAALDLSHDGRGGTVAGVRRRRGRAGVRGVGRLGARPAAGCGADHGPAGPRQRRGARRACRAGAAGRSGH